MFARRASSSSAWTAVMQRPPLVAHASRFSGTRLSPSSPPETTSPMLASDFLDQGEATLPTRFELEDGPPTAENGIDKQRELRANASYPKYRLHCHASPNNTITTFTADDGSTIAWTSGGRLKFKGANRSTYDAGYQCAVAIFQTIKDLRLGKAAENGKPAIAPVEFNLELFFKGFGEGREAMKTALLGAEGEVLRPFVVRITDRTPLKIGGTRSKKRRHDRKY